MTNTVPPRRGTRKTNPVAAVILTVDPFGQIYESVASRMNAGATLVDALDLTFDPFRQVAEGASNAGWDAGTNQCFTV